MKRIIYILMPLFLMTGNLPAEDSNQQNDSLSMFDKEDIEIIQNLEFLENLEILENIPDEEIDLAENLEAIENMNINEAETQGQGDENE